MRSIATEQKMLDAAEELLHNGNAHQVTVQNVVQAAGATVGSFYARFGSLEGLLKPSITGTSPRCMNPKFLKRLAKVLKSPT